MDHLHRQRLSFLDGLRGIAAAAVMGFHYEGMLSFDPGTTNVYSNQQYTHLFLLGVELFFIISGFVILMSAERAASPRAFLLGRAARIYPAYLLSVVPAGLAALILYGPSRTLLFEAIANATMFQRFANYADLATPYWTLAYELWFYLVIALLLRFRLISIIPMLCIAWLFVFFPLHIAEYLGLMKFSGRIRLLTFIDFGSFFICGMMTYLLLTGRSSPLVKACLLLAILFTAVGRHDWAEISGLKYLAATCLFEATIILCCTSRLRVFELAPLVWLGQRSYSLYLLHVPIVLLLWAACRGLGLPAAVSIALAVPVSLACASLSRRFIEIPGQRWLKHAFVSAGPKDLETSSKTGTLSC